MVFRVNLGEGRELHLPVAEITHVILKPASGKRRPAEVYTRVGGPDKPYCTLKDGAAIVDALAYHHAIDQQGAVHEPRVTSLFELVFGK